MIPYDDLVAALSNWRARQGLPVSTMSGGSSGPQAAMPGSGPTATPVAAAPTPGSGPRTAPPGAPPRTSPPGAPPARSKPVSVPPPLPDAEEVDASMLDEAAYDNEGNDFAMSFGGDAGGNDGDGSTAIGGPPQRDTLPSRGRKREDDEW